MIFIMIGATTFSLVFQAADGPKWVEHLLTSLPGSQVGFLIVVNIMIFFWPSSWTTLNSRSSWCR